MEKNSIKSSPLVSIVIPAYNEEKGVSKTIESVLKQDYSPFEVLVVDNNSTDNTKEVAREFGVRVLSEKNKGVAHARQLGFTEAKGDIIISTDADTIHPKNWISNIIKEFSRDPKIVAVGGLGEFYSGPPSARFASKYLFYPFLVVDKIFSGGWNLSGFNMAIKKDAFMKTGGFATNLHMGEDIDLSTKLRKIGKVVISKNISVKISGRRYKDGLLRGLWDYVPQVFSRFFLRKNGTHTFRDVRE